MSGPRPFHSIPVRHTVLIALFVLVAAIGPGSASVLLARQDADATSLVDGRAKVVAQGVAVLPAGEAVWRTVRTRAAPIAQAEFEPRPLGFVLAASGPLLLTDRDSGDQLRLGPGEAAFVREGAVQRRSSLGDDPVTYLSIELVATDAPAPPIDAVVLQPGQSFAVPPGLRDLDLLSGDVSGDEQLTVSDTGAKNVVLVTDGAANVGRAGGEPVVLLAGEAATFSGELLVAAAPGGEEPRAAFVVATIGVEVPPPAVSPETGSTPESTHTQPAATPAEAIGSGSISLQVFTCPPGMDAATLAVAACAPAGPGFDVAIAGESLAVPLTIADAVVAGSSYTWGDLPLGNYRITLPVLPPGADAYVLSARNASGDAESGFTVTLDGENPDLPLRIYVLFPA
jgi:hypothetical protein